MKDDNNFYFLYDKIKQTIYKPYQFDEDSSQLFSKENIYNKENLEKLNDLILSYRKDFKSFVKDYSNYELKFDDKSIIILDLLLSDFYKASFIDDLDDDLKIQKFISTWVGYLGSYIMSYIKKKTRITPKIEYPIYDSYFNFDGEKVFPYFIAMKKISVDMPINFYEYLNELVAFVVDEDFKINDDYVDEIKTELRPFLVKWFLKN